MLQPVWKLFAKGLDGNWPKLTFLDCVVPAVWARETGPVPSVCLWRKPQNFSFVPVLHERRTVASSFVCTAVSLCGEALLFPALPPGQPPSLPPSLLQDRPRQVWTDVNFWLLSLTRGVGGVALRNLFGLFLIPGNGCHASGDHWSLGANRSLLVC